MKVIKDQTSKMTRSHPISYATSVSKPPQTNFIIIPTQVYIYIGSLVFSLWLKKNNTVVIEGKRIYIVHKRTCAYIYAACENRVSLAYVIMMYIHIYGKCIGRNMSRSSKLEGHNIYQGGGEGTLYNACSDASMLVAHPAEWLNRRLSRRYVCISCCSVVHDLFFSVRTSWEAANGQVLSVVFAGTGKSDERLRGLDQFYFALDSRENWGEIFTDVPIVS